MNERTLRGLVWGTLLVACGGGTDTAEEPNDAGRDAMQGDAGSLMDAGKLDASSGARVALPLVTPPVRAATPPGLGGTAAGVAPAPVQLVSGIAAKLQPLDSVDFKSRFFTAGPTSVFQILATLDSRIEELNARVASDNPACAAAEPVGYTLTPFGQSLTFYAQCFQSFAAPGATEPSFLQFGRRDGVAYVYIASGAQHVAARLTPVAEADAGAAKARYRTDVWIGVGYDNAGRCGNKRGFDSCSYGAIELHTDEAERALELTVAGLGFGYCGAQLKSDGARVFGRGSLDMGTTCLATTDLCVAASDVTTPETCTGALTTFATPALGRKLTMGTDQSFGASLYPGDPDNQITLTGLPSDSLGFGPREPTSGVGALTTSGPAMMP